MSLATLPTDSDILDERGIERAGEFLHDDPETASEFRIPQTDQAVAAGNFIPTPAAPYVEEVDYHADRAAEAVRQALEIERRHVTEVTNAGGVVKMRDLYLESQDNQLQG
jgi:hypothetical protein